MSDKACNLATEAKLRARHAVSLTRDPHPQRLQLEAMDACIDQLQALASRAVSQTELLDILEPVSKMYPEGSIGRSATERVIAAIKEQP